MANEPVRTYKHILLPQKGSLKVYAPKGGPQKISVRQNNRASHSAKLTSQIAEIASLELSRREDREVVKDFAAPGICITFQGAPNFDLLFEKLEFPKDGIELLSVFERDGHTEATCYIPEGKLEVFLKRIQDYASKDTRFNRPAYADLINSIDNIKAAALREFWTDENPIPETTEPIWWEVWLRAKDPQSTLLQLQKAAEILQLEISEEYLSFPDRLIVQILATSRTLTKSIDILNLVSEIRMGNRKPSPRVFPNGFESNELLKSLQDRLNINFGANVGVAILDTGINRGHPLLSPVVSETDMHASYDDWLVNDHHGHGTTMAGLAAFGDLWNAEKSAYAIDVPYHIESIKILPPIGENPPHLFGKVVEIGIRKCENQIPDRKRIYSKSITSSLHKRGDPSSYSAKIDELASGATDHKRRLFVISAGNTESENWHNYPTSNFTSSVEEPAQAWNALTVGASTELVDLPNDAAYLGWSSVAPQGDLSPFSCTSTLWTRSSWPYKPDVVWEGGNCAIQPGVTEATEHDTLSVLTTNWQPTNRLFTTTCMTSAATAQVAGLAGKLLSSYPFLWPETVRAVIVHSATWTQAMKSRFPINNKNQKEHLLRACGYGIPDENLALNSLSNNVVLITQDEIQPFQITKGKGKAKQLQIHNLPWPTDVLHDLGETEVKMKVTLSYFIEPNPAQRGWQSKFRYQSFGLRFDLKRKDETEHRFEKRVTKLASDDNPIQDDPIKDNGWTLGDQLRNKGSIHSDIWTGTAVALAARNKIAIYPVLGWWRERLALGKCEKKARYSLIVSITSSDESVNLYEEIQLQLGIPIENSVVITN